MKRGNKGIANYNPYVYEKGYKLKQNKEEKITTSIKPIDREKANIEAEVSEVIMKPGLMGMHKIAGKKHEQGGTPLFVDGGSFILSNDPNLAISKEEKEIFEFKTGNDKKSESTPAKVLLREVKPENYNKMINIINDPKADAIAKATANLMLTKYQNKVGQVAYLQEDKKNNMIPNFALGTAPVADSQYQNIEEKQQQYMRKGGSVYDPGGQFPPIEDKDKYPGGKTKKGRFTDTKLSNSFNYDGGIKKLVEDWKTVGIDLTDMDATQAQKAMYDWAKVNNPQLLRTMWKTYGMTAKGKQKTGAYTYDPNAYDFNNLSDEDLDFFGDSFADGMLGARTFGPTKQPINNPNLSLNFDGKTDPKELAKLVKLNNSQQTDTSKKEEQNIPTNPYKIKGNLNNQQLADLGRLGLEAMSINKYMPAREQIDLPEVRLDKVNDQPYLNAINNQTYAAYKLAGFGRSNGTAASSIYGKSLDAISQARGQVDNQNIQIGNQENLTNLQQANNELTANVQMSGNYYDEVQRVNQNYDDERRYARNQFASTLNKYQSDADKLAWKLASVNKYGKRPVYDKNGNIVSYDPVPYYQITQDGIVANTDVHNFMDASGADKANSLEDAINFLKNNNIDPSDYKKAYPWLRLFEKNIQNKNTLYNQNPFGSLND